MPARAPRPDVPQVYSLSDGQWRVDYGGCRGWAEHDTLPEAIGEALLWHEREIDAMILYLDELRRNRNRLSKRIEQLEANE